MSAPTISIQKINNEVIEPMKVYGGKDIRPVLGYNLFPEVYANIFLCARKKSGKSICIQKILKSCTGPNTTILAFCSTVNKDNAWISIKKWAEKKGIAFNAFPSIKEHKVDFLESFLHKLEQEAEEEEIPDSDDEEKAHTAGAGVMGKIKPLNLFGGKLTDETDDSDPDNYSDGESSEEEVDMFGKMNLSEKERKMFNSKTRTSLKKKDKFQAPEYILVFDDLSHELKLPSLVSLLKKNRHYKLKVIISSQYIHDLKPESLKQIDYLLLFKGLGDDKLEKVRHDADLSVDQHVLQKLYNHATSEPYHFLYVDSRNDQYRNCFDKLYKIAS